MARDAYTTKRAIIDLLSPVKEDHFIWKLLGRVLARYVDQLRHPQSLEQIGSEPDAVTETQNTPDWFEKFEKTMAAIRPEDAHY